MSLTWVSHLVDVRQNGSSTVSGTARPSSQLTSKVLPRTEPSLDQQVFETCVARQVHPLLVRVYYAQPKLDDENGVFWDEARNPFLTISQMWAGSQLPIASHPHADQCAFDRGNNLSLAQRHYAIDHLATAFDPNLVV